MAADLNVGVLAVGPVDESDLSEKGNGERDLELVVEAADGPCLAHFAGGLVQRGLLREREALVQAWTEGLPPAHAALVQRYFRDLARNAKPSQPTPQGKQR